MESSRPLHERVAACVVSQQYSSATFVSLPFHSRKKKVRFFKCYYCNIVYFHNDCVTSEIAYP